MALCGEVNHGTRFGISQQVGKEVAVANVAANKFVAWVAFQLSQVFEVASVGEQVEVNYGLVGLLEPVENKVRADEAGSTGNKDGHVNLYLSE